MTRGGCCCRSRSAYQQGFRDGCRQGYQQGFRDGYLKDQTMDQFWKQSSSLQIFFKVQIQTVEQC